MARSRARVMASTEARTRIRARRMTWIRASARSGIGVSVGDRGGAVGEIVWIKANGELRRMCN